MEVKIKENDVSLHGMRNKSEARYELVCDQLCPVFVYIILKIGNSWVIAVLYWFFLLTEDANINCGWAVM